MENSLTPELIRQSRNDAEARIREAESVIIRAQQDLSDAEAAERLLARFSNAEVEKDLEKIEDRQGRAEWADLAGNPYRFGTNKAYIWQVLFDSPRPWMTANGIQDAIEDQHGEHVPMTSISPMLSEMKQEHLERDGLKVALKLRLEATDDGAQSVSDLLT